MVWLLFSILSDFDLIVVFNVIFSFSDQASL
jgi:hypothetical protein